MSTLERLLPMARLVELDHVDLAAPPARVWELVRHGDLARSPFARALFTVRNGPVLLEPIGFAMDRRMLLGVKARVESTEDAARRGSPPHTVG